MNLVDRVKKVLNESHLMSLGTFDDDGVWVADIIFLYDDSLNIYWLSSPDCRHSRAILKNDKVAGTITYSNKKNEANLGLQIEGKAERLEGIRPDLILKHLTKRGHKMPDMSKALEILDGDCWYILTPTKIELIDEENFGFKRQSVNLIK